MKTTSSVVFFKFLFVFVQAEDGSGEYTHKLDSNSRLLTTVRGGWSLKSPGEKRKVQRKFHLKVY